MTWSGLYGVFHIFVNDMQQLNYLHVKKESENFLLLLQYLLTIKKLAL